MGMPRLRLKRNLGLRLRLIAGVEARVRVRLRLIAGVEADAECGGVGGVWDVGAYGMGGVGCMGGASPCRLPWEGLGRPGEGGLLPPRVHLQGHRAGSDQGQGWMDR